jgi:hypothetical protein
VEAGAGAYPLVKVDYAMVPTSGISVSKANHIAAFLKFAAGAGQGPTQLPPGYLPLPADLQAQSMSAAEAVLAAPTAAPPAGTPFADVSGNLFDSSSSFDTTSSIGDLGDLGLGGSDFSSEPATDTSGFSSGDGSSGSGSAKGNSSSNNGGNAKALSVRFLGSQGHLVLPFLLVLGLAALIAGPTMMVVLRRKPAGATVATGPEPGAPETDA